LQGNDKSTHRSYSDEEIGRRLLLGKHFRKRGTSILTLPTEAQLVQELRERALCADAVSRGLAALETGIFAHPDGRTEQLGHVRVPISEVAMLSHLCWNCPSPLSVEVGFGMGSTAAVILGTLVLRGGRFEHLIFDPKVMGRVVADYLKHEFGGRFRLLRQLSEIGLARLLEERGRGCVGLAFIDGNHKFEGVMTDFVFADQLCCIGGFIVFDDALYPAVETVLNYIEHNRPDYVLAHLPVENCSVVQKVSADERKWYSFAPFPVPPRSDWTPAATGNV
jgi:hypothetical protein